MLVNCAAYRDGRKVGDIEKQDIKAFIEQPECFVTRSIVPSSASTA